ncbi:hypothetical protein JQR88_23460 (plasmid) [Pseudomonas luteola]|uniref:hypothetical protein n=1 Tax=Pseudomonas luteola TaxID=47886 RepID=UPI003DA18EA9
MGYGLLPLAVLFASTAHAWPTPQAAVDQYLQFELSGGRLQSWNYSMYLADSVDYDEPGWDMVHVIRTAHVQDMNCSNSRCTANVLFTFVPTRNLALDNIVPHPDGGSEVILYTAVRTNGEWLLEPGGDYPRVAYAELKRRGLLP